MVFLQQGAQIGFIAVLHRWSQTLMDHPHVHCIVTGGGLSQDGTQWIPCKEDFFLPVRVLSRLFRGKLLAYLKEAWQKGQLSFAGKAAYLQQEGSFHDFLNDLYKRQWVVYCKHPFPNAEKVTDYLDRYTTLCV
ncbi:MAG: transposase [Desulfobacteraceae bacterium]